VLLVRKHKNSQKAIKTIEIAELLIKNGHEVIIIPTTNSLHFVQLEKLKESKIKFHLDIEEWTTWSTRGDPVLHIEVNY
jgi:phosphopantothenoylcysteine synthetase/decarboxylase